MLVLLLSSVGDTKIPKTLPALRSLVVLLEEKTCACKMSHEKKVVLDPESQKMVPTVSIQAPAPILSTCGSVCWNI